MTNLEFYKEEIKKVIDKKIDRSSPSASLYEGIIRVYRNSNKDDETYTIFNVLNWLCEEHPILDKEEKEYLSNVIKPFRKRIDYIIKRKTQDLKYEYIAIFYTIQSFPEDCIYLPYFKKRTMYKDMELDKEYTLEELGL